MTSSEQPDEPEEITAIIPAHLKELAPVANTNPVPPREISETEAQELQSRAGELVKELEDASGSRELELIDGMTSLGLEAQRGAGNELDLLRGRVGSMITTGGPGAELTSNLLELRLALNQINPHELDQQNRLGRFLAAVPLISRVTPGCGSWSASPSVTNPCRGKFR